MFLLSVPRRYFFVDYVLCLSCFRICILSPWGYLLGKGWPLGIRLWCLSVFCHFPMWYPRSGVVLHCIDSWSLPLFFFNRYFLRLNFTIKTWEAFPLKRKIYLCVMFVALSCLFIVALWPGKGWPLVSLVCAVLLCFVTFLRDVLCQVLCMIVSIPDFAFFLTFYPQIINSRIVLKTFT